MTAYTQLVQQNLHRFREVEAFLPFDNPTFHNPDFQDAPHRLLIVRLSPFRDVDRSIAHLFLFQEARRALPDAYIDMAFFPSEVERGWFSEVGLPYLVGTQSHHPAGDFDLLLISNAYTLELINLPYLLLHSGVPLFASQRGPEWPPLILGGSNALAAQAIIRDDGDSLVDGIFFGEGEGWVGELVTRLARGQDDKQTRLRQAAQEVEGFWAAGLGSPSTSSAHRFSVAKAVARAPQACDLAVSYPLLNSPEAHTSNLQVTYGCPAFCTFCFEGYDRKPYREIPLPELLATARRIKAEQGAEELNLYSFNFNTHQDILSLLLRLHHLFDRVSFKSQRIDILQHAGYLLEAEVEADKRSYTLGIEGISARQRALLHKSLPTGDIAALLDRLLAQKIREVKLFYVLTGHEQEEDILEFREFVRQLKELRRVRNRGIRVIFSFGLLIRMPFTPLRYDRLYLDEAHWRPLIGQAKSACETNGFEFRLAFEWGEYCTTQVLALGGYWLVEPIVALAEQGYSYDTTLPPTYWEALQSWMRAAGRWDETFLGAKEPGYPFALEFVRSDIDAAFLYRQYQEAIEGRDRGYCLGSNQEPGTCLGCGACASAAQREALTQHQLRLPEQGHYLAELRATVARKRRLPLVYWRVRLDPWLGGVLPAYLNAYLFHQILACCPDLVDNLLSVRESLFTVKPNEKRFPVMGGETVLECKAWDTDALRARLLQAIAPPPPAGFEILGAAEHFSPGTFTQMRLHVYLPAMAFPEPRRALDRYLRRVYVPYSLRREEGAGYRFDVPQKGLKKKVLLGGSLEEREDGFTTTIDVGYKFDLMAFLGEFGDRNLARHARASVSALRWDGPN
jgi:radical SAM superfamily enzyme YgiQ (UPF0313 family)